jgi:Kef-type K+ transport system membrane component KefB
MTGLAAITLESPKGGAWEFLVLFLVVILGPPLVQRMRIPGIIGLLVGGFLIGPNGLGLLDAGSTTIPDLGQLGLLYLMFVAGVELDLALLRQYRRSAISFGLLTFSFPMLFGTIAAFAIGWNTAAALLLGSLLASHTLVLYPLIRDAKLANDPMVASTVGATVLTDTIALVILAVVAGTQSGSGSGAEIAIQIALGLTVLGLFCFLFLPFVVRRLFRLLGTERTVRYVIAVAAFLAAAVVAETFQIEGIVGAFFAGLAMNRLVPNEGPLMTRIDFFGSALFVPVFLVSVGLLLKPSVMIQAETLGLAALFIAACIGGKFLAAQSARPLLGASGQQAGVMFALSTPQAAATLASTTVGFQIGLFSDSVVNAVLVLIFVSVVLATLTAERYKVRLTVPPAASRAIGEHVLVAVADLEPAPVALRLARAVAEREAGIVDVLLVQSMEGDAGERRDRLDELGALCRRLGIDADPEVRVTDHFARTVLLAASDRNASMVMAVDGEEGRDRQGSWADIVALTVPAPMTVVRGKLDRPLRMVRMVAPEPGKGPAAALAAELVAAVPREATRMGADGIAGLEPGDVAIAPVGNWEELAGAYPPDGAVLVAVPDGLLPDVPPDPAPPAVAV